MVTYMLPYNHIDCNPPASIKIQKYRDTSPILRTAERTPGTVLRQVQCGPSASFVACTRRVQCTSPILRLRGVYPEQGRCIHRFAQNDPRRRAPSVNLGQSPHPPTDPNIGPFVSMPTPEAENKANYSLLESKDQGNSMPFFSTLNISLFHLISTPAAQSKESLPLLCKEGQGEVETYLIPSTPPALPLQRGGIIFRLTFSLFPIL